MTGTSSASGSRCGDRKELFFDEMSATVGYLSSAAAEIGISKRVKYLNDRPNYGHFLFDKKFGPRAGVSADFTSAVSAKTWRAATNVNTKELRSVDSILFENYWRTNNNAAYGFALTASKAATRKLGLNGGYASIDRFYGGLNSDRFHVRKSRVPHGDLRHVSAFHCVGVHHQGGGERVSASAENAVESDLSVQRAAGSSSNGLVLAAWPDNQTLDGAARVPADAGIHDLLSVSHRARAADDAARAHGDDGMERDLADRQRPARRRVVQAQRRRGA